MKLLIVTLIFFSATLTSNAQVSNGFASNDVSNIAVSPVFQKQKFSAFGLDSIAQPPGLRMRKTGRILTVLGIPLLISGIIVFSASDKSQGSLYLPADGKFYLGIIMMFGGTGMTTTGIILGSVGNKKYNRYLEKQGATTSLQWKGNALSLTYRF